MEITLIQAMFGMGNQNHDHVHRHNKLNLTTQNIDILKSEQFVGGVTPSTLNRIAAASGEISANPQGFVNIEDGWNVRRGIGMLRFSIENNSLNTVELTVLGYLTGGGASVEGIEPQTMFVPVRSWSTNVRSTSDLHGFPTTKTVVDSSTQFLLGDPTMQRNLKSIRPIDVGNELLGMMACEEENNLDNYDGVLAADLNTSVIPSKTDNLNPTHHSRELLKIATNAAARNDYQSAEISISDSLYSGSIGEMSITENEFFQTMMFSLGTVNLAGFNGFSLAEICQVFQNFPDVLNIELLDPLRYSNVDNLLGSEAYGSVNAHEIVCTEIANITAHLLMRVGLTTLNFSATNNPHDVGGLESEDGIEFVIGEFMSVFNHDENAINRVEHFKQLMKQHFFSKYSTGYIHTSTIMNLTVKCNVFGETIVTVFFNGDESTHKTYVNATYCLNRTSSNISGSDLGLAEAKTFMQNIKEYFIS